MNSNMKLTKEQTQTIINNGKLNGLSGQSILDGLIQRGYEPEGIDVNLARQAIEGKIKTEVPIEQPKPSTLERIKTGIEEKGNKIQEAINGEGEYENKTALERGVGATAQGFSAISSTLYNSLPETARKTLDKVGEGIGGGVNYIADKISNNKELQEAMSNPEYTKNLESGLKIASDLGLISGEILGVDQAAKAGIKTSEIIKNTSEKTSNFVNDIYTKVPKLNTPELKQKVQDFFSNNVDEKITTILKETPTEKFDEYIKIAEDAMTDPRKLTPLEVVGDKMAEGAKKIKNQVTSFSKQKKDIINKAKVGLDDFSKETGSIILDVNRALKNSPLGSKVISILKKVKTKLDADNAIDEIQDLIYKGNKDMTIPTGSSEDKALRGIIGKYNGTLKNSLPESYSTLNTKISSHLKILNALNRSLGEVVDGVSTRGAGLIKQFFSPSGRKAKELFDYIKESTGIDLAQDSTLAKFAMEISDDARARALLEGIPTSVGGLVNEVVNFTGEKLGVGKGIQKTLRKNTIEKSRRMTK